MAPLSVKDADFTEVIASALGPLTVPHRSPPAWEDQVLYFLLPDRFSNGDEKNYKDNNGNPIVGGDVDIYTDEYENSAIVTDEKASHWRNAGGVYVGGKLKGITSKLGYLQRLGVTAVWIGPIFRQVPGDESLYHGYACQNFLEVEPRLGTGEDLKELVREAHKLGIYVILDIILNHSGDIFGYVGGKEPDWTGRTYQVEGFRDSQGKPTIPMGKLDLTSPPKNPEDCAIWPNELQDPDCFTCQGQINNWDNYPEYLEGDFFTLKDLNIGRDNPDDFVPTRALKALSEVYKYWIAYADIDGFRIDTVKHMGDGPCRYFATQIHEFAQSIGKDNYFLVGEITGGRAWETVEATGLNAALGIGNVQENLWKIPKGFSNPSNYFDLFRNAKYLKKGSHAWCKDKVVTMIDDHDQVWRGGMDKERFCATDEGDKLVFSAVALNLCTLGVPCIYYGTEQSFDGKGGNDRYIREAMFGGDFGPFRSEKHHCFDENSEVYQQIGKVAQLRQDHLALRRGRQYLREISGDGINFGYPTIVGDRMRSVVGWSRMCGYVEILCAINTDPTNERTAWVTIDNDSHEVGDVLVCLFPIEGQEDQRGVKVEARNGKAVLLTVPPGGFVMFK